MDFTKIYEVFLYPIDADDSHTRHSRSQKAYFISCFVMESQLVFDQKLTNNVKKEISISIMAVGIVDTVITLFVIYFIPLFFCLSMAFVICLKICTDYCCKSTSIVEEEADETMPNPEDIVKITDVWVSQENEANGVT